MDKARIEDFLRHPVAAEIPHDAAGDRRLSQLGVPVVIGGHSSPATAAFERLASALTGEGRGRAAEPRQEAQPPPARVRFPGLATWRLR